MTAPQQQTLCGEATFEGVGLHTGRPARLRFKPAAAGRGILFRRVDLEGQPEIPATLDQVTATDRGTSLGVGEARVHTVEHLLAAAAGLGVDNLEVEIDGPELPIGDGSFLPFLDLLARAGVQAQGEPARVLKVTAPVSAEGPAGARYLAMPAEMLRVSASIEFEHPLIGKQFRAVDLTPEEFERDIAGARTFGFKHEAEALYARGLALGATLENAVILDDTGIASGALRFPDEFVRHKVGDLLGDISLVGARVQGHIVAERPSHAGNLELARALRESARRENVRPIVDIQKIMQYLPHRYPMLLVDRIIEFEAGKRIVGLKNVTINEPFFQGHYPGHPIMPGVLIIEAMAQVGGLLLMDAIEKPEDKVVYFMSLDNVKWRRPVTPGDQIRFELEMLQFRRHVCRMRGVGTVDGHVVAEAEMMARIVDR
jgi:UDP-3-O-[3-hydroxymyristoyl] N-acetylglucosamine deacetylase/3-hydroxyacyl-[acyl-carrier-protein] dehydratase